MGLDMYAVVVASENSIDDFSFKGEGEGLLHTWRKHPDLHGWMEKLWLKKLAKANKDKPGPKKQELVFQITSAKDGSKVTVTKEHVLLDQLPDALAIDEELKPGLLMTLKQALEEDLQLEASPFNQVFVRLTKEDIAELGVVIASRTLPKTTGFFFGESNGEERDDDLLFIGNALKILEEGKHIYYSSWW